MNGMNGKPLHSILLRRAALLLPAAALALGLAACGGSGAADKTPAARAGSAPDRLPAATVPVVERALDRYEAVRAGLAGDDLASAVTPADSLARDLRSALLAPQGPAGPVRTRIEEGAVAAEALSAATDLKIARSAFSKLSEAMVDLVSRDPGLAEGRHLVRCPMVPVGTYNQWIQSQEKISNPYMGKSMPTCGVEVPWPEGSAAAGGTAAHDHAAAEGGASGDAHAGSEAPNASTANGDAVAYYTCPMHPSVKQSGPGTCPICGMDLVPVTRHEVETGVVVVDSKRQQEIGVRTAQVARRPLTLDVRAVGHIAYDETRLADVSLKFGGWIGKLQADSPGMPIRKGQTLFTLYSPELFTAQQEYLTAVQSRQAARGTGAPDRADYLVRSARQRLRLWDLTDAQIDEVAERGAPLEYVPILSPVSGYLVEKNVVEGSAVKPGERLLRIAGLDKVWIEAELYESQLPLVHEGLPVRVTLPYLPGTDIPGKVAFVYPYLDDGSRTGRVRIELANKNLELKPAMYATVNLELDLGSRLTVPESAVIYAGPRRAVFVQTGEGRFEPRVVETGAANQDWVEVLSGVREGDTVVSSGNFLIAAESRLKTAMENW